MRALLIGGSGFIGSKLVEALSRRAVSVAVVGRTQPPHGPPDVRWIRADRSHLRRARPEIEDFDPRVAIDLISYSERDALETCAALLGIVEHCVVASSGDVYRAYGRLTRREPGELEPVPILETAPLRSARYPYRGDRLRNADDTQRWMDDYEKILVEDVFRDAAGFETTILRLPMVYGPGDRQHRFAQPILRMLAGRPVVPIEESAAAWRTSFSFVDDVAEALAVAATGPARGATYNVSERDAPTQHAWVDAIAREAGWHGEVRVIRGDSVPDHLAALSRGLRLQQDLVLSSAKLRAELGFEEVVDRATAIRRTLAWERSLGAAVERIDARALEAEDLHLESRADWGVQG